MTTSFDGLGQPFDLTEGETHYVDAAGWTAQGGPSVWALGDSGDITRRWDYDPQTLRVTQLKAGTSQIAGTATVNLMRLEYSYDDSGNVTRILDYKNSSQYECYGYDSNNRLTDAFTGNSGCTSYSSTGYAPFDHDYAYDDLHNLRSLDGPTYSYGTGNESGAGDAGPHAVTEIGTTIDFGYDDNGNRITKTVSGVTTGYTFNFENRLAAVDLPSDANDVVFVYDADGRRVKRSHGTYSTTYVAGLMEIDRTNSTVTQTRTFYGFAGVAVAVRTHTNAATTFVFQNHLGSTVTAFNDTSNTHLKQYYYPYGAERYAVGTLPLDQRYTGQTSDATSAASAGTGLLYYNARYYDPTVGAFTSADTIIPTAVVSASLNRYVYGLDNPIGHTDPSGRCPTDSAAAVECYATYAASQRGVSAHDKFIATLWAIWGSVSMSVERYVASCAERPDTMCYQMFYASADPQHTAKSTRRLAEELFVRVAAAHLGGLSPGNGMFLLWEGAPMGPTRVVPPPGEILGVSGWRRDLVDDGSPARHLMGYVLFGYLFGSSQSEAGLRAVEGVPNSDASSQQDYDLGVIGYEAGNGLRALDVSVPDLIGRVRDLTADEFQGESTVGPLPPTEVPGSGGWDLACYLGVTC